MEVAATRRLSAAVFGNEKVIEVVLCLASQPGASTAQDLARLTGVAHSMVRDVLVRLAAGGLLVQMPKLGGSRSPQFYEPAPSVAWTHLVALAETLAADAVFSLEQG